ncbi:MAG: TonB family protein [Cyanobacteria bacterium J06623_4]
MGFSKDTFEQYRREIRITQRVLVVAAVVAGGAHFFSLPWISRMISGPEGDPTAEVEATPVEIVVEEEPIQQAEEPEPETPEDLPEPAASADQPSAPPLATDIEPVPLSEISSADRVAVAPAIATENGVEGGQGAAGASSAVGLVPGSGEPVDIGDLINLPDIAAVTEPASPREPIAETSLAARRQPSSRLVSCDPCSVPDYPANARREEIEGQPVINAIFDENGRVIEAVIEVSSGNRAFDEAALEEARRNWRFRDPQGVGGQVSVGVTYVIEGSNQYQEAQQAGEIRTVELPVNQQIRSVAPDQPVAPAAGTAPNPSATNQGSEVAEPAGEIFPTEETPVEETPVEATATEESPGEPVIPPDIFPEPVSPESAAPEPAPESVPPPALEPVEAAPPAPAPPLPEVSPAPEPTPPPLPVSPSSDE